MKKHLEQRNEKLFNKLFENQGIKVNELSVPEMTAWQALEEEEEETLEEVHAHRPEEFDAEDVDGEDEGSLDNPEEEEITDEEVDDLMKDAGL